MTGVHITESERVAVLPWFLPTAEEKIAEIFHQHGKKKTFKAHELVFSEHQYLDELIYLKSGVLTNEVVEPMHNKAFVMCGLRLPGTITGYMTYLIRNWAPVRLTALTEIETLSIGFSRFDTLLEEIPEGLRCFTCYCGRCNRSDFDAMLSITTMSAEESILVFFAALFSALHIELEEKIWVEIPLRITQDMMARVLYTSRLTIERVSQRMRQEGILKREKRKRYVYAPALLPARDWFLDRQNT